MSHRVLRMMFCLFVFCRAVVAAEQPPLRLAPLEPGAATFRLYEGITLLVNNPEGKPFTLRLDVRELNLTEPGAVEALFKVYDPDGKAVVREVIPDDGVTTPASQLPPGGWDHEGWYYIQQYNRGTAPMLKWSALVAPDRLAATPVRTYERQVPGGPKGTYRVVLVGSRDHVASVQVEPKLAWAVGANPFYLHPVGNTFAGKRFFYVPAGTSGLAMTLVEHDRPRARRVTLKDDAGTVLAEGTAAAGIAFFDAKPATPGAWDGKVFSVELDGGSGFQPESSAAIRSGWKPEPRSDRPNACLLHLALAQPKLEGLSRPLPPPYVPAFFAADAATAKALRGGAIERDGKNYWQPAEARLMAWVKSLPPDEFEMKEDGKPLVPVNLNPPGGAASPALPFKANRNAEFFPLNGPHERPPLSDTLMFSYDLHRNRPALNVAIRDVAAGLGDIGPGDHVMNATWKGMCNLAYENGTYRFHWWRPAWRLLQEKDTPPAVKAELRELIQNAGDRLAFCRNWERVNGNAFATVLCGLRYAAEGTGDPLHKQLCDAFHQKFTTGGFGDRVGVGPSGPVQEEFAYDNHYGSYTINTLGSVARDLQDPRFVKLVDGLRNFYSYTWNDEAAACAFSARTNHNPDVAMPKDGPYVWKGLGGPDLTESIAGANEFFAARRAGYYVLSYHGRMTPKWEGEGFRGQMGFSGGMLCQFVVPGKGTVIASTVDAPGYGTNTHPSQWRTMRVHGIVGMMADGRPLVASDSEHLNARLTGNTVTGSGEVRDCSVHSTRSYTYNADHVVVDTKLRLTDDEDFLGFWFKSPFRGHVTEAWEMIPFLPQQRPRPKVARAATSLKLLDAAGKETGELSEQLAPAQTIVIDRGGFGVRIELEKPTPVKRGAGNTVLIQLIAEQPVGPRDEKTKPNAENAAIRYKLVPFGM